MADTIPPGFGQVTLPIRHSGVARAAAITFGIDMGGSPGSVALCNKIAVNASVTWGAALANEVTAGPVRLEVGQDGVENIIWVGTTTFLGGSGAEKSPSSVALLVTKITSRGGRRGRGRYYIPWLLSEANVTETGTLGGAEVTARQAEQDAFLLALSTAGSGQPATPMVLLHSPGESSEGVPNPVTSLQVQALIGTQRRRLGR